LNYVSNLKLISHSESFGNGFSVEFGFFFGSLESSVSHFGSGIDEFKSDFFVSGSGSLV
jgi:hypothetical protein